MADALTIGWNDARVRSRRTTFQRVFGFNMLLHVIVGLACMFAPYFVAKFYALPAPVPTGWVRGWGATLILVTALYVPGLQDPLRSRSPIIIGIGGRVWMATLWFIVGGGFFWFGVFDGSFAIILGWLYYRYCIAEVMSRP
jgi:hypothetical protein